MMATVAFAQLKRAWRELNKPRGRELSTEDVDRLLDAIRPILLSATSAEWSADVDYDDLVAPFGEPIICGWTLRVIR